MRIEVEEVAPRHWLWSIWLADVPLIHAEHSSTSREAAEEAAVAFCREVGRAPVRS